MIPSAHFITRTPVPTPLGWKISFFLPFRTPHFV